MSKCHICYRQSGDVDLCDPLEEVFAACIYIYIYVRVYVCMYACIYIY